MNPCRGPASPSALPGGDSVPVEAKPMTPTIKPAETPREYPPGVSVECVSAEVRTVVTDAVRPAVRTLRVCAALLGLLVLVAAWAAWVARDAAYREQRTRLLNAEEE